MKMLSDLLMVLLNNLRIEDLPVNVLINDKYYDIDEFYFDNEINEYIMKVSGGIEYSTRGELINK